MKRLFGPIAFFLLVTVAPWAQSTWRGQAEVWSAKNVPADGLVAASNEFPINSLLNVENYKTKKTIQVRVVAPLPAGSTDLVLLSPKAALALEIKVGEVPLVGVQIDTSGSDRPDNPDPDVNPLAQTPASGAPVSSLPLPAVTGAPLAVADEPDNTPSTPGKKVFESTKSPDPLTTVPPAEVAEKPVEKPAETPVAVPDQAVTPAPEAPATAPAAVTPLKTTPASAWVATPGKLQGPILGQIPLLASLEQGKPYVQLGAWATEAEVLTVLDSVKSYVPLSLYKADGQKNPWRVVASAPKGQLGMLLMLFRSEGLRTAAVVKG